jgi:hypothetical protein
LINARGLLALFVFQFKNKWDILNSKWTMKDRIRQQMIKHPNHLLWDKDFIKWSKR